MPVGILTKYFYKSSTCQGLNTTNIKQSTYPQTLVFQHCRKGYKHYTGYKIILLLLKYEF